ncbi:hypothetical protein [Nocardia goodfellowii]|uniref:Serine peptidase n=1 Tax=Nocardia goodfellowii TaxID=882446 RepID=A0ABS4QHM7_9NOCA|nr:hypothetical protein [Nocardia goodfellowii]MBP2191207.1 hypothetical protein [Nocardia goodfellowii]
MSNIVGVHGINNYRPGRTADDLSVEWCHALGRQVHVAYYSEHLRRGIGQGSDDPMTLEPAEQEMLIAWVDQLQPVGAVAQGPRTARLRQASDWLTRKHGDTARRLAVLFCREVHTYLAKADSPRRTAARATVAAAITEIKPTAVVAHSLGSVVAYETLWQNPHLSVDLLITVGSPLAMPGVVLDRLDPSDRARPPGVQRWVNLADVGDIVAVPRGGLGRTFAGVEDIPDLTIGNLAFHGVQAYLRTPELRAMCN